MKPVTTQTIVADSLTPVAAYAALRKADAGPSFLLESVVSGERWGRYSILGYRPRREVLLNAPAAGQSLASGDPFAELMSEATVVVFDNLRQTVTIASTDPGDVERARHDLDRGATLHSLATP